MIKRNFLKSKCSNSHSYFSSERNFLKSKCSQITIFVILALIIIVTIALVYVVLRNNFNPQISSTKDPQLFIENCMQNSLEKYEALLLENNGNFNITDNYILYDGKRAEYYCKASIFYTPCVNQRPMLLAEFEEAIKARVKKDAETCFSSLIQDLKSQNYKVSVEPTQFSLNLELESLEASVNKKITLEKNGETRVFEIWKAQIPSSLYRLASTARNIVNYESTICFFDYVNWVMNYPEVKIKKFVAGDGTKVYSLEDQFTGDKLSFAVKTCILPAGI